MNAGLEKLVEAWTQRSERALEFFWLVQARRRARLLSDSTRATARRASQRAAMLARLGDASVGRDPWLSWGLYRDACFCLARACLMTERPELALENLDQARTWQSFERLLAERAKVPEGLHSVSQPEAEGARWHGRSDRDVASRLAAARQVLFAGSELLELRSPLLLEMLRVARLTIAALGLGCVGLAVVRSSQRNLALHQRVTASSRAFATTPDGAVDGIIYNQLGFHSSDDGDPRLVIELARPTALREVIVYGRADCCHDQSIPLALEVSDDGSRFRSVAERSEPFSQVEPWRLHFDALRARFLRLHTLRKSVLVLSEVQVFGSPL